MKRALLIIGILLVATVVWAVTANDNFNRASLGANWSQLPNGYPALPVIFNSIRLQGVDPSTLYAAYYNAITPSADQFSQVTIASLSGAEPNYIWVSLRQSTSDNSRYTCLAAVNDDGALSYATSVISVVVDGVGESIIADEFATPWQSGDVLRCDIIGQDIYLKRNGGVILTANDNSLATGRVGVEMFTGNTVSDLAADDWQGGDIAAPAAAVRHRPLIIQ